MSITIKSHDKNMQRMRLLAQMFTKTNRILTGNLSINVHCLRSSDIPTLVPTNRSVVNAPGFTMFPNIYINYELFGDIGKARTLVQLLGLNYHELSHVMFTPNLMVGEVPYNLVSAFNILEDQRIESLFTAMYEPAGKYFTEMVVKFMVEDKATWDTAFLWTYGRSFLPLEIRQEFESRFSRPDLIEDAKRIINKYKSLDSSHLSSSYASGWRVVEEFNDLLNSVLGNSKPPLPDCDAQTSGRPDTDAEENAKKEEKKRSDKEEETGEDQSGFWEDEEGDEDDGSEDGGSGSGEDSEEEDSDDAEGDGDGDTDGVSDDGDDSGSSLGQGQPSDEVGDEKNDSVEGGGAGSSEEDFQFSDSELEEYLNEIIESVVHDEAVVNEVDRVRNAINDRGNIDVIDFGECANVKFSPPPEDIANLKKVTADFRKLYADMEPGWKYGSNVGRLNVGRAMYDPEDYENHFDEWEEGREQESGLEVFICLDISGSMALGNAIGTASRALWIIKRALDEVGAKTTVVGFHAKTIGLFGRNEKADRDRYPHWEELGPSTNPAESFHIARRVLSQSDHPNKLFVVITDGSWSNHDNETHAEVSLSKLLELIPGKKMYVGIASGINANGNYSKLFDTSKEMTRTTDLVDLVNKTVTNMIRR